MLTTQTDPPVTPVTPVPCKCSQPLSEHCTNSHTVTPWQKGLKALEDTLDCLDAFEAGTRERPPRLDDTLVDWFHRRHPSDLGLTFNAIKPRLDEAWAEHARRKEAEVARLQELQRRAGSSVSTPRSPPASQQSPRPTGQPQARSTPVTTAQVTRPPPPQSFAAAAQTPVTHKSQARLPCSTKDPKARPADWKSDFLEQLPLRGIPKSHPKGYTDADEDIIAMLMRSNEMMREELLASSHREHLKDKELEENKRELEVAKAGHLQRDEVFARLVVDDAAEKAFQEVAQAASEPILRDISAVQSSSLDLVKHVGSLTELFTEGSSYHRKMDSVKTALDEAIFKMNKNYKNKTGSGAFDKAMVDCMLLYKNDQVLRSVVDIAEKLESLLQSMSEASNGEVYVKHTRDAISAVMNDKLTQPLQDFVDERAALWGYDRGMFEGVSFQRAPEHNELILKIALYHGFVMAQGIMARDLAEVNGPWQGVLDEVFTVAWHQCTSFHHRLIHGLRITDEQMEHHLQQARNYSRIVARQIERQEFNNLTDPSRLTFVGNLERPGATDYFKIVVPFDEERVVEASSDPRELFHQLPLDRLQPAFQEVIKNGREGWYDHHALGNKLSKVARTGRVWKIHNSARRQADELGSPPSQQ